MPGLGLVPMMLQMNLNKLLFLMIDSNPKNKETKQVFTSEITEPPPSPLPFAKDITEVVVPNLGVSKYVRKWYYKYCFAYFGKDFLTGK